MTEEERPVEPEPVDPAVLEWSEKVRPFLDSNPEAGVEGSDDGHIHIIEPWGDSSIRLDLDEPLVGDLNSVRLFPKFSAVYHLDTGDLEVIWAQIPESSRFHSRSFEFEFEGHSHVCEFAKASDRLRRIAASSSPKGHPEASYRNLALIAPVLQRAARDELREHDDPDAITSFWIREAPVEQQALVVLANHLNFYMWYYDLQTPRIVIHEQRATAKAKFSRRPIRDFPPRIVGERLDPALLGFWEAGVDAADPARAMLHYYRIIEYGAFYHIDQAVRHEARRVLREPDALSDPDLTVARLLEVLARGNREEHEKLYRLFKSVVDPAELWTHIEPNADHFTQTLSFDGGFEMDSLLTEPSWKDFERRWDPHFAKSLRLMRNALVHGRERREVAVILQTARNHELIRPWVDPTAVAAGQIMLFAR